MVARMSKKSVLRGRTRNVTGEPNSLGDPIPRVMAARANRSRTTCSLHTRDVCGLSKVATGSTIASRTASEC